MAPSPGFLQDRRRRTLTGAGPRQLALRLWVRLFHWGLDHRLASGVDPASEPALAVRASQLLSDRHRRRLAASLERVVREADASPRPSFSVVAELQRDQVAEARTSLLFLAYLLRHAEVIGPRGVAIVERLLCDGGSALYVRGVRGGLALQVQTVLEYLVGPSAASPEAWFSNKNADHGDLVGDR